MAQPLLWNRLIYPLSTLPLLNPARLLPNLSNYFKNGAGIDLGFLICGPQQFTTCRALGRMSGPGSRGRSARCQIPTFDTSIVRNCQYFAAWLWAEAWREPASCPGFHSAAPKVNISQLLFPLFR